MESRRPDGTAVALSVGVLQRLDAQCPHCGFGAGVYLSPREERTPTTPVRCVSCYRDALIREWVTTSSDPRESDIAPPR
jgi:hypothetical protein